MYYYIFDIKKCGKRSVFEDIKNHLSFLGISGEFVYPSAAYSAEELVDLGLSKKYNTIVGIGSDDLANKIAGRLCGRHEAMGFIPLDCSDDLKYMLGAKGWKDACENLRYRKITELFIGKTANGGSFLTNVKLELKLPTEVTIEFKDFMIQAKAQNLMISNFNSQIEKKEPDFLDIVLQSINPKDETIFTKLSSILGVKKELNEDISMLRARSLRLFTSSQIPLIAEKEAVAKTPQLIESSDEKLRLIVGKTTKLLLTE